MVLYQALNGPTFSPFNRYFVFHHFRNPYLPLIFDTVYISGVPLVKGSPMSMHNKEITKSMWCC